MGHTFGSHRYIITSNLTKIERQSLWLVLLAQLLIISVTQRHSYYFIQEQRFLHEIHGL